MPYTERPLESEVRNELSDLAADGAARLFLSGEKPQAAVIAAVNERIDAVRPLAGDDLVEEALALGCLWGEQVRQALKWEWTELRDVTNTYYALVSPDRAYAIFPTIYMRELLADAERDNTAQLLFNMLVAGSLPPSAPKSYYALA